MWGAQTEGCVNQTSVHPGRLWSTRADGEDKTRLQCLSPRKTSSVIPEKNVNLRRIWYAMKNGTAHCFPESVRFLLALFLVMAPMKAYVQRPEALLCPATYGILTQTVP